MLSRLGLMVVLVAVVAGCADGQDGGRYPVRWTPKVDIKSLDEIPAKLQEPVRLGENDPAYHDLSIEYKLEDGATVTQRLVTGADYLDALSNKHYSVMGGNNYQLCMESFFLKTAGTLDLLRMAKPSKVSWVSDFSMSNMTLRDVPWSFVVFTDVESDGSYADVNTNAAIIDQSESRMTIIDDVETSNTVDSLTHLAWGDFNGDGIEDLLFFCGERSLVGSFRYYHHVLFTRTNEGVALSEIEVPGGW